MAPAGGEEQLLFGVLAVQLGLATPQQVMAQAAAWMADRDQGLAERLRAAGVLDARQCEMIGGMLAEALRAHGGSPHDTLDALGGAQVVAQTFAGSLVLEPSGEVRPADGPPPAGAEGTAGAAESGAAPADTLIPLTSSSRRYQIRSEYGRGGQAQVMLAFDPEMGREVAFKELLAGRAAGQGQEGSASRTSAAAARFLREARITGQLEHPNIVPVYELGAKPDGQPYYTMRLVRGETLDARLRTCRTLDERMKLLGSVWDMCNGIAYAHSRGVIHRDIKPANVMVGEFGETVILDWGLAKAKGAEDDRGRELARRVELLQQLDGSQTLDGSALGTPSYMSPEQAEGAIERIDERSDVWGLGAVLYELLAGQPPFVGETPFEVVGKVMRETVRPVAELCPEAPQELAAVAAKALHREPAERYQSAGELAAEISAYMTGRRVGAYAYSGWDLLKRFARRHRALVASGAALLVVILAALVVVSLALRDESRARAGEQEALARAQKEQRLASFHLAQAYAKQAERLADERLFASARIFAARSLLANPASPAGPDYRPDFEVEHPAARWLEVEAASLSRAGRNGTDARFLTSLGGEVEVRTAAFLGGDGLLAAGERQGRLVVLSLAGERTVFAAQAHDSWVRTLAPLGGERILTAGDDGSVKLWQLGRAEPLWTAALGSRAFRLAVAPDRRRVAVGLEDRSVALLGLERGERIARFVVCEAEVHGVAFSPGGDRLAAACWDKTARLLDPRTGRQLHVLRGHPEALTDIAFSPDGRTLATGDYGGQVRLWDAQSGELRGEWSGDRITVQGLAFSPDGRLLATCGDGKTIRLFDAESGALRMALDTAPQITYQVAWSADGRRLAACGGVGPVSVFEVSTRRGTGSIAHPDWIYGLEASPDGGRIATAAWDGGVRFWDASSLAPGPAVDLPGPMISLAYSPDGRRLAVGSREGPIWLLSPAGGGPRRRLEGHGAAVTGLVFSPDGSRLLSAALDRTVRLWDPATGRQLRQHRFGDRVWSVQVTPDGGRYLAAGDEGLVSVFDLRSGRSLASLRAEAGGISDLRLARDGKWLAASHMDGAITIWDLSALAVAKRLVGYRERLSTLAFSPDAGLLATAGDSGRIVIWDWRAGRPVQVVRAPNSIQMVLFTRDGQRLAFIHKNLLELVAVERGMGEIDPAALLERVEHDAGRRLEGFSLVRPGAAKR